MTSVGAADVIQGGALVILLVFVAGFVAYFRERDKRSEELTKQIVERALNAMDAGVKAQQATGEALAKLCLSIDVHDRRTQEHHETVMEAVACLSRQSLGSGVHAAGR